MAPRWCIFACALLLTTATPTLALKPLAFENVAVVRSVELGGTVVHVTTTFAVRALQKASRVYSLALSSEDYDRTTWIEARLKGEKSVLDIGQGIGVDSADRGYYMLDITLPQALDVNATATIVLDTTQTHATRAWPQTARQNEGQALKYTTDLFVLSPYRTVVQRTKLNAHSPNIFSFTKPEHVEAFVREEAVAKKGPTVTYGPFHDMSVSTKKSFLDEYQQPITVHYAHDQPVIEITKYRRSLELSHWGANMNTQDEVVLYNAGPALKGHFSRIDHQLQMFHNRQAPHVLPAMQLQLPPNIRNTYYYDLIGNVSTSKLRVSQPGQPSLLELRPRYPILGGWNYSFTLGWDAPLQDSVVYDARDRRYIAAVPVITRFPGTVLDDVEVTVVLPEGATDVTFTEPFPSLSSTRKTHTTFLDTTGRPALVFVYKDLTLQHAQNIYVSYKLSVAAHWKKPIAVGTAFFAMFMLALVGRRVDLTLHAQKV